MKWNEHTHTRQIDWVPGVFLLLVLTWGAGCTDASDADPTGKPDGPTIQSLQIPSSYAIEASYLFELGQQQLDRKQYADAVASFQRMIRLAPGNVQGRIQLCAALYRNDQSPKANRVCRETFAYAPDDMDVLAQIVALYIDAGQRRQAIEPLQQALVKWPGNKRFEKMLALADKDGTASIGGRMEVWVSSAFRCRAISTMRFRPCRFEPNGKGGYKLRFKAAGITCNEVAFDDNGDPAVLKKCYSSWPKVPSTNKMFPDSEKMVWSGSKRGWGSYCCPGMWIQAPRQLQNS